MSVPRFLLRELSGLHVVCSKDVKHRNIRQVGRKEVGAGPAGGRFILGRRGGLEFSHPEEAEKGAAGTLLIQRNGGRGGGNQTH